MTLPILDRRHYRRTIDFPVKPGWNPSTHLAKVDFGDGVLRDTWIKVECDHRPAIANEAIGWLLAGALDIPTPSHAGVLIEDCAYFKSLLGDRYPNGYAPESGLVGAWCCADMGAPPLRSVVMNDDYALLGLLRTEDGARLAAFDHWLANEDRNTGNLLRLPRGQYAAIDHGILFRFLDWRKSLIDPDPKSFLWDTAQRLHHSKRLLQKEYNQLRSGMVEFGHAHHRIAGELHSTLDAIIAKLENPIAAKNVLSCINARCGHSWIGQQVGLLI